MDWLGDFSFLNQKNASWVDPDGCSHNVKWDFVKYTIPLFPFYFFQCNMHMDSWSSTGFGTDANIVNAARKSFAEAWERLWVEKADDDVENSNGFAAGASNEMAITNSKNELFERKILLDAWSTKTGWNASKIVNKKCKFLSLALKLKGWSVSFFDIKSNIGSVKVCLLRSKEHGAILDSCYLINSELDEEKLLLSTIRSSLVSKKISETSLPLSGGPETHQNFYLNPKNLNAFNFLDITTVNRSFLNIKDSDLTKSGIITPISLFPAIARSSNSNWQKLIWGKLSISGENEWPHPLA